MNWIIILIIAIVLFIVLSTVIVRDVFWDDDLLIFTNIALGVLIFVLCLVLMVSHYEYKKEIVLHSNYAEVFNDMVSDDETFNYAMNTEIIGYNSHLLELKTRNELYGNWSLIPDEIQDVEYIKLD